VSRASEGSFTGSTRRTATPQADGNAQQHGAQPDQRGSQHRRLGGLAARARVHRRRRPGARRTRGVANGRGQRVEAGQRVPRGGLGLVRGVRRRQHGVRRGPPLIDADADRTQPRLVERLAAARLEIVEHALDLRADVVAQRESLRGRERADLLVERAPLGGAPAGEGAQGVRGALLAARPPSATRPSAAWWPARPGPPTAWTHPTAPTYPPSVLAAPAPGVADAAAVPVGAVVAAG
jgi:hypothetical protein